MTESLYALMGGKEEKSAPNEESAEKSHDEGKCDCPRCIAIGLIAEGKPVPEAIAADIRKMEEIDAKLRLARKGAKGAIPVPGGIAIPVKTKKGEKLTLDAIPAEVRELMKSVGMGEAEMQKILDDAESRAMEGRDGRLMRSFSIPCLLGYNDAPEIQEKLVQSKKECQLLIASQVPGDREKGEKLLRKAAELSTMVQMYEAARGIGDSSLTFGTLVATVISHAFEWGFNPQGFTIAELYNRCLQVQNGYDPTKIAFNPLPAEMMAKAKLFWPSVQAGAMSINELETEIGARNK